MPGHLLGAQSSLRYPLQMPHATLPPPSVPLACSIDAVQFPLRCGSWTPVACDLGDPSWADALLGAGFDPAKPTVWVAEGELRCPAGRQKGERMMPAGHALPLFSSSRALLLLLLLENSSCHPHTHTHAHPLASAGLLMYLEEAHVRALLATAARLSPDGSVFVGLSVTQAVIDRIRTRGPVAGGSGLMETWQFGCPPDPTEVLSVVWCGWWDGGGRGWCSEGVTLCGAGQGRLRRKGGRLVARPLAPCSTKPLLRLPASRCSSWTPAAGACSWPLTAHARRQPWAFGRSCLASRPLPTRAASLIAAAVVTMAAAGVRPTAYSS